MAAKRKSDVTGKDKSPKKGRVKDGTTPGHSLKQKNGSDIVPKRNSFEKEEPDFPRGGSTPSTKTAESRLHSDPELQQDTEKLKKIRKRQQALTSATEAKNGDFLFDDEKLPTTTDLFQDKSLSIGMKIWGTIVEIDHNDMVVSLPGRLRGYVRIQEASDVLAELLQAGTSKKEKSKGKSAEEAGANKKGVTTKGDKNVLVENARALGLSLKELFSIGQLVACSICSLREQRSKEGKLKPSKRVGLSLRLSLLYEGLTTDVLHEGMPITGCVKSIEDHGYLLTFGVPGISGVLLLQNYEEQTVLKKGQLVQGVVLSVDQKRGVVSLKAGQNVVVGSLIRESAGISMELLVPGLSVNARVLSVLERGLILSFLTYFSGTVSQFHFENPLLALDWREKYTKNQRLKAKILSVDPVTKAIGLTLNMDLLRGKTPSIAVNVGGTFDSAIVRRVDPRMGLLIELPSTPSPTAGYAPVSLTSDVHDPDKLEKKFSEGKKVGVRVVGFRNLDGLATVSLKKTDMEQLLLSITDIKPGMLVYGNVTAVEPFGAIVALSGTLKGACRLEHMSELQRDKPSPKFQVGARLKFRVLSCDLQSQKIFLTHKKSLVSSKLSPITSYDDAVEGQIADGWITGFEDYGCFVNFYNKVAGLAHKSEWDISSGTGGPETMYKVGQVVKCRIIRVDPSKQRISLSFNTTSARTKDNEAATEGIESGHIVSGDISHMQERSIMIDVHHSGRIVKGILAHCQLSDNSGHVELLKSLLEPGYTFDRLLVLEKSTDKQILILSAKFSLIEAGNLPSDVSQLHSGAIYQGFIANITDSGCFVRFLSRLTGLVYISNISDSFAADASKVFAVGQSVRAQVLKVDEETGKFSASLKPSVCFSTNASLIQGYFVGEEQIGELSSKANEGSKIEWSGDLKIGSLVDGEVQEVKDYGVIVTLYKHKDIIGFLTHHQIGNPVEKGQKVEARVLDLVKSDGIVDLTLRSELFPTAVPTTPKVKKRASKKRAFAELQTLELHSKVNVVVELVKNDYLVLSLPENQNALAYAATRDYNLRSLDPHQVYKPGQRLGATIQVLPHTSTGGRLLVLIPSGRDGGENLGSETKKLKDPIMCKPGSIVSGKITAVNDLTMVVDLGKKVGVVHVTEVWDDVHDGHPFAPYVVDQTIKAKVLKKTFINKGEDKGRFHILLSIRPSAIAGEGTAETEKGRGPPSMEVLQIGQLVTAFVQFFDGDKVWMVLGPRLRGGLHVLDSSNMPSELLRFKERFQPGHAVTCQVLAKNPEKEIVHLSIPDARIRADPSKEFDGLIERGMILGGKIETLLPAKVGWVIVQIGGFVFGRVHITHLSDVSEDNPHQNYKQGQFVRCVVLELTTTEKGKSRIELSLKPSMGGSGSGIIEGNKKLRSEEAKIVDKFEDLSLDLVVQGYVKDASKKGVFVTLSPTVDARIVLSELSDSFVGDLNMSYPPGKLVKGRIMGLEPLSRRVEMSLKESNPEGARRKGASGEGLRLENLKVGDEVNGKVRRIESFGVFIAIDNSDIIAMAHLSEISDSLVKNIQFHFSIGQNVRAKILKIQLDKRRVSLGLKESYFSDASKPEAWLEGQSADSDSDVESLENFGSDSEDDVKNNVLKQADKRVNQESDDLHVLLANKNSQNSKTLEEVPALQVNLDAEEDGLERKVTGDNDEEDAKVNEDEPGSKMEKNRAKKRLKKEKEENIRAAEEKRLQEDREPETADDFEQLVRSTPNSSFVWVKFMAFVLGTGDVDKAREIAERALKVINFREENEKLNVWVAYLNLENAYGNPKKEAVLKVFQRAMQFCDPKKLQLALLGIYERSEQHDMADELLQTLTRKLKTSAKVWLRKIQNLLTRGMDEAAQKTFDQSLLSLPKRKHVKMISQVAIMEFKIGSPERARSIFEGVVRNYPKRTDLWSVYLDQEIRLGDLTVIRTLFERAVSMDLPPKKIKFLFKKYLDFEKVHGDEERTEYVKKKAMDYVENKLR